VKDKAVGPNKQFYRSTLELYELLRDEIQFLNLLIVTKFDVTSINLQSLILSQEQTHVTLGLDFALMLYQEYKTLLMEEICSEAVALKLLQKRESVQIWRELGK
jgi:hypothetical protein